MLLVALLVLASVPGGQSPPPPAITVSAAISLTSVLEEVAKAYTAAGGGPVRFNLAASNVLARQILNGAPADLFISADEAQLDLVEQGGLAIPGTRTNIAGNQLVVIASAERAVLIRDHFARAPAQIRRLAIGDPAAVPAGVYARQYLESIGAWQAYEPRLIPTTNVRAALAAVDSGAADAAIVYATDAPIARHAAVALRVPREQGPRIVYPAALLTSSRNPAEGKRFLAFLTGREASAIFARHGFIPPPSP